MIVFLTLCYCGLLFLLVKWGVVKWTLWWKLSPLAWMLLLLAVLFIPMQWGAPVGPVNVYQNVVEVVPNVSGEVIDVPVKGLEPLKKGDILFQIDPTPYQATVDQLRAQLAETQQNVQRLKASAEAARASVQKTEADVELAKADQAAASAAVTAAKAALQEAKGNKDKAVAVVGDLNVQVRVAQRQFDRLSLLVEDNAVARSEVDRGELQITGLKSRLKTAEVDARVAEDTIAHSQADVAVAETNLRSAELRVKQLVETELPRVRAKAREAELLATSMIGDQHTSVATVQAQLKKAEFDLQQTSVRAPSEGLVYGVTLRPGQRVAAFPTRSWMSFVPQENATLGVGIPQYALRHVRRGQKAEVTFKLHPGRIFAATVDKISDINPQGQQQPSGTIMTTPGVDQEAMPFGVRLKLDDDIGDISNLPGGASGTAVIYTDHARLSHLIRRVMLRMEAWLNYVKPW